MGVCSSPLIASMFLMKWKTRSLAVNEDGREVDGSMRREKKVGRGHPRE